MSTSTANSTHSGTGPRQALLSIAAATVSIAAAVPTVAYAAPVAPASGCPALYVLGVPGTGEISSSSSTQSDSGMLGAIMSPLLTMASSTVQRAYVPYPAGFGGAVGQSDETFQSSALKAVARTESMIGQVAKKCGETTRFGLAGYSQGAYAASLVAQKIGRGDGPVPADRVVGVSLLGDPTRPAGSGWFPGTDPSTTRPQPAPGTAGAAVEQLPAVRPQSLSGGGIGPTQDAANYGELTGRVASPCAAGDLTCDAPSSSPVVHLVTNIAGQSKIDTKDPVKTLTSIGEALALTTVKTVVPVINEDVEGDTVEDLAYEPNVSISQRLATASDPRTPLPSLGDALTALTKVGTIGLNAAITVAQKVFTPDTIAALATTGLTNPPAALAVLGAKALQATVQLVPPATVDRWANEAFTAVTDNLTDNADLLNVSNLVGYWRTAQEHTSYAQPSSTLGGLSPTKWTALWFAALAADLSGKQFSPRAQAGAVTADPSLPPSPAVVPSVPDSLADDLSTAATTTTSPAAATSPMTAPAASSPASSTSSSTWNPPTGAGSAVVEMPTPASGG